MLAPVRFSMHARTGALEEDALEDAPLTELKQSKGPFRRGGDDGRATDPKACDGGGRRGSELERTL